MTGVAFETGLALAWRQPCLPTARQPVLPSHGALREEQRPHLPKAELATRSISTVFRARGRCLAFSFLLVASTPGVEGQGRADRAGRHERSSEGPPSLSSSGLL